MTIELVDNETVFIRYKNIEIEVVASPPEYWTIYRKQYPEIRIFSPHNSNGQVKVSPAPGTLEEDEVGVAFHRE